MNAILNDPLSERLLMIQMALNDDGMLSVASRASANCRFFG